MGAKTGLLVHTDGTVTGLLKQVGAADPGRMDAMMRRLYPGWAVEATTGSTLADGVYPPDGQAHAGSWPGVNCSAINA